MADQVASVENVILVIQQNTDIDCTHICKIEQPDQTTAKPMELDPESYATVSIKPFTGGVDTTVVPEHIENHQEMPLHETAMNIEYAVPDGLTYQLLKRGSEKRKDKVYDSLGYSYVFKSRIKDGTQVWKCPVRNKKVPYCPATVRQKGDRFTQGPRGHSHAPVEGAALAAELRSKIKDVAEMNPTLPASKIVEHCLGEELRDKSCNLFPNIENLVHQANRYRQKRRCKDSIPDQFPLEFRKRDLRVRECHHTVFATDRQLNILKSAQTWYMDASFKVLKPPFTHLFSIHAYIHHDDGAMQVPVCFALMSGGKKRDYKAVLNTTIDLISEVSEDESGVDVRNVVADFEKPLWKATASVFPDVEITGCGFHFEQAVWSKVQKMGLRQTYLSDFAAKKFVKQLMGLRFLPAVSIDDIFERLADKAWTTMVGELIDYFRETWIQTSLFKPETWSVYHQNIQISNDFENWNMKLKISLRANLLQILLQAAILIPYQMGVVSGKKLRKLQRKKYGNLEAQLFSLWWEYERGAISLKSMHKECSLLYEPKI